MFNISQHELKEFTKLSFSGMLVYEHTKLANELLMNVPKGKEGYLIELTNLEKIDSTGFGVLINFASDLKDKKFAIIVNNDVIERLLKIAKFDMVFSIVKNEQEGITVLENDQAQSLNINDY